jgi:AcrR family transcriptional regulator
MACNETGNIVNDIGNVSVTETKPRWARRKEARPQELLSAALDEFVEHGFAATRLEEVARKAGVSKGTLYLYFDSKEELFMAVVMETIVPNLEHAEKMMSEHDGDTGELFKKIIHYWLQQISTVNTAGICKLMFAEASNFPDLAQFYHDQVIARNEQMMVELLKRGMDRGEFRQVDLTVMPKIIVAPMVMLMMWTKSFCSIGTAPIDMDRYVDAYVENAVQGLLKK